MKNKKGMAMLSGLFHNPILKNIFIIGIVVLLLVFMFYSPRNATIGCYTKVASGSVSLSEEKNIIWNDFDVKLNSAYFGSMIYPFDKYNGFYEKTTCGEQGSDKSFYINNEYRNEKNLILISEYNHIKQDSFNYGSENFINAEIKISKKGTLNFIYSSNLGYIKINSQKFEGTGEYSLDVDASEIIKIELITTAPSSAKTEDKAVLELIFIEDKSDVQEETTQENTQTETQTTTQAEAESQISQTSNSTIKENKGFFERIFEILFWWLE